MPILLFNIVLERRNCKDKLLNFSFRKESVKKIVCCLKTINFILLSSHTMLLYRPYQRERLGWCIKLILEAQWILSTEMCHICQFPIEYSLLPLCPLVLSDCKIFLMQQLQFSDSLFADLRFKTNSTAQGPVLISAYLHSNWQIGATINTRAPVISCTSI